MTMPTLRLSTNGKKNLRAILMQKAEGIAYKIYDKSQENIKTARWATSTPGGAAISTITDTGSLARTGEVVAIENGYKIRYGAKYAQVVEEGLRKGVWVPIKVLQAWAGRKLRVDDPDSVAYAVRQKIHAYGIAPRPFLSRAFWEVVEGLK